MRAQAWISSKQETEAEEQKQNLQNTEKEDSLLGGGRDSVKTTELYRDYFKKWFFLLFFNSKHLIHTVFLRLEAMINNFLHLRKIRSPSSIAQRHLKLASKDSHASVSWVAGEIVAY